MNKSVLFNLLKRIITLSKLGKGGIQDSQVITIPYRAYLGRPKYVELRPSAFSIRRFIDKKN